MLLLSEAETEQSEQRFPHSRKDVLQSKLFHHSLNDTPQVLRACRHQKKKKNLKQGQNRFSKSALLQKTLR